MPLNPYLVVVVGAPGSGKDLLIRAVNDLGTQHAQIVPKHTSRQRRQDDGNEMICPGDKNYNIEACDIIYENYGDRYGFECSTIWQGLKRGIFQVIVVSDINTINKLKEKFRDIMISVYVHSETNADEYERTEVAFGEDTNYVKQRSKNYRQAFDIFLKNYLAFDHVFIYTGNPEDLFDQIFRLFRAYERGYI